MKTHKNKWITAVFAACLILLTSALLSLPQALPQAEAAEETDDLRYGENDRITRADWLHDLAVLFEMTADTDNLPDNYYADLTPGDAAYSDVMLNTEYGILRIDAGENVDADENVTREFAAQTLNDCLGFQMGAVDYLFRDLTAVTYKEAAQIALERGWFSLVGTDFEPAREVTEAEVRAMLADARNVPANTVVADRETDVTFAAFVKQVPKGTDVSMKGDVLTISGYNGTLAINDTLAVFFGELPAVYTVKSVSVKAGVATVTTVEYTGAQSPFTSLETAGNAALQTAQFTPAEDMDVTVESDTDGTTLKNINANTRITLENGASLRVNATLSGLSVGWHAVWGASVGAFVHGHADVTATVKAPEEGFLEFPDTLAIGSVNVPGFGVIDLDVKLNMSSLLSYTFSTDFTAGLEYNDDGFRLIRRFTKDVFNAAAELDGTLLLHADTTLNVANMLKGAVQADCGVEARHIVKNYNSGAPLECTTVKGWMAAKITAVAYADIGAGSMRFAEEIPVFEEINSPARIYFHLENGEQTELCTREGATDPTVHYTTTPDSPFGALALRDGSANVLNHGGNFKLYDYTLNSDQEATITRYYGNAAVLILPETLDGHPVTEISGLFGTTRQRTLLRSVVIPDTVTEIGSSVFNSCVNLSHAVLSMQLTTLGSKAFGSTALTAIEIPKSLDTTSGPFAGCALLKNVIFENNVTEISQQLFSECTGLEQIVIPDTVTEIEYDAFYKCTGLRDVTIGSSVSHIDDYAFYNCTSLPEIVIPNSVTEIEDCAFSGCTNLRSVVLSKNLTTLGYMAFAYTALSTVEIPKSLDACDYGMSRSYQLNDVSYSIQTGPFYCCELLETASFEANTTEISKYLFAGCVGLRRIVVPDTVTEIEDSAFSGCLRLSDVTIGRSVGAIDSDAFYQCVSLPEIVIPDSVTEIEDYAFDHCASLAAATLSKNLTSLGYRAFGSTALKTVHIPKSLTTCDSALSTTYTLNGRSYQIGSGPFSLCEELKSVSFEQGVTAVVSNLFAGCVGLETVVVPDTVLTVEDDAFFGCVRLQYATIGKNVSEIEGSAFQSCASLLQVTFPVGLRTIESSCFYDCSALPHVTLPDTVETLGDYCFAKNTSLTHIDLSANLRSIGNSCFASSTALPEIELPDSLESYGTSLFEGCTALLSAKLPRNVTSIPRETFSGCVSLKRIEIPTAVETIESSAFYNCAALEGFSFTDHKSSLKTVNGNAFTNCAALQEAIFPDTVETIGQSFQGCTSLEKVWFPQSLKTLASACFKGDAALIDLRFSDYSITTLQADTFMDCASLHTVELPKGLTTIGKQAFRNDTALVKVIIPESVNSIERDAFSYSHLTVIYGKTDSAAEIYADDIGFQFVAFDTPIQGIALSNGTDEITIERGETRYAEFELYPADAYNTVTLTESGSGITVNGMGITGSSAGDYTVTATSTNGITYDFTVHVVSVNGINITKGPDKLVYTVGEAFDPAGMEIEQVYSNGQTAPVTGFTVSELNSATAGEKRLTVTWKNPYGYSFTAYQTVTVVPRGDTVTGITIAHAPDKRFYLRRENLDLTGLQVLAQHYDGTDAPVTDYTVSGYNALKLGEQTITVTYAGFTAVFTVEVIVPEELTDANVTLYAATVTYNGKVRTPSVTVKNAAGEVLTKGDDYTVTVPGGRTNAGAYVYVVTGTGRYTGVVQKTFTILPQSLSLENVALYSQTVTYNGKLRTPVVTVKNAAGETLTADTDYTVTTPAGRTEPGNYTYTVQGKGNYTGTVQPVFTILPKTEQLSAANVTLYSETVTYNGKQRTPSVTVKNAAGKKLVEGTDYTVTVPAGRTNAGTYTYTITGKGNYAGTVNKVFTITAQSLTAANVTLYSETVTYNGKQRTPSVTVKNAAGETLKAGTDYIVTVPAGRTNAGTYTYTITGKGNYAGSVNKVFTITAK